MARISEIILRSEPAQTIVSIRKTIDFKNEFSPFMEEALARIKSHLICCGAIESSGPVVCFHNTDLSELNVEVGYYLAREIPSSDEIKVYRLADRKVFTAIDQGPYGEEDSTLTELIDYVNRSGYETLGGIYYYYLNDPNRAESLYLTQMVIPVRQ